MTDKPFWQVERSGQTIDVLQYSDIFLSAGPIKSVVKESTQNSCDAVDDKSNAEQKTKKTLLNYKSKDTVSIEYEVLEVTGSAKKAWIESIDLDGFNKYLKHIKDSSAVMSETGEIKEDKTEIKRQSKIHEMLKNPRTSIFIMNIIDRNTIGLNGKDKAQVDDKDAKFHSFFKSIGGSRKIAGGGSWGVGKNAFAALSSMNTILSLTNLKNPESADRKKGDKYRIFGMSINKAATLSDQGLRGGDNLQQFWFFGGQEDGIHEDYPLGEYSTSVWNNKELAKKLLLDSRKDENGTTIQIPLIDIKTIKSPIKNRNCNSLEEFMEVLEEQISIFCWPAIISKKIEVKLRWGKVTKEGLENNDLNEKIVKPNENRIAKYFIDIFNAKIDEKEIPTEYGSDSSLFELSKNLEFNIPESTNPKDFKDKDRNISKPSLIVSTKALTEDKEKEATKKYINKIALIRNSGIVVDYFPAPTGKEDLTYFGVLLAGTALKNTSKDVIAEKFLRTCEDPAHNNWVTKPENNKLNKYFEDAETTDIKCGERKLYYMIHEPIRLAILNFFKVSRVNNDSQNKFLNKQFLIKKPKKDKEEDIFKSRRGKNSEIIQIGVEVDAGKEVHFLVGGKRAFANTLGVFDNEKGGKVKIKEIRNEDKKTWNDSPTLKKTNFNTISANNSNSSRKKTFWIDLKLNKQSEVGVAIPTPSVEIPIEITKKPSEEN